MAVRIFHKKRLFHKVCVNIVEALENEPWLELPSCHAFISYIWFGSLKLQDWRSRAFLLGLFGENMRARWTSSNLSFCPWNFKSLQIIHISINIPGLFWDLQRGEELICFLKCSSGFQDQFKFGLKLFYKFYFF